MMQLPHCASYDDTSEHLCVTYMKRAKDRK